MCRSERDAATARLSAVVPQLEALEATWARLHGICGADTAEDLIAYWQGECGLSGQWGQVAWLTAPLAEHGSCCQLTRDWWPPGVQTNSGAWFQQSPSLLHCTACPAALLQS